MASAYPPTSRTASSSCSTGPTRAPHATTAVWASGSTYRRRSSTGWAAASGSRARRSREARSTSASPSRGVRVSKADPHTVLIVDDDRDLLELMAFVLMADGLV